MIYIHFFIYNLYKYITCDNEVRLTGRDKFRAETVLLSLINCSHLYGRESIDAYSHVRDVFALITGFNELNSDEIRHCSLKLAQTYPSDLQADELANEMIQFVEFENTRNAILPAPWPR
jgi:hypothetical protein